MRGQGGMLQFSQNVRTQSMLSPLADSGDNNVLMQSIHDYNQSLFEFVCLILLLFFTKMEARV